MNPSTEPALRQPRNGRSRMWARRIILPLFILLVAWAIMAWSSRREELLQREIEAWTGDLVAQAAQADEDGASLLSTLDGMEPSIGLADAVREVTWVGAETGIDIAVQSGDLEPPFGDGSATHRALLRRDGRTVLTLRMLHSQPGETPRVLGYVRPDDR